MPPSEFGAPRMLRRSNTATECSNNSADYESERESVRVTEPESIDEPVSIANREPFIVAVIFAEHEPFSVPVELT